MKKKITFGLVTFAMVAASAVFMKSIAKDDLSAMIQANVDALAEFYHVSADQVFVGVGSDDVLAMCFLTFFN